MFKFVFQFFFYALALRFVVATSFNECSQGGVIVPEEVSIDGCESSTDVCKVKFNGALNMTMKFKAPHYLESIVPKLTGKTILGQFNLTVESDHMDVCVGILNTVCPLVAHEIIEYEYSTKLLVLPLLPITLEFSIVDTDLDETTLCFTTDVYPIW